MELTPPPSPAPLLIWGAGGHAKVVAEAVFLMGCHEIVGYLDDVSAGRRGERFQNATILGGREILDQFPRDGRHQAFVAFGHNAARLAALDLLRAGGWKVPVVIHPAAMVSSTAALAEGACVMAGAVLQASTRVGRAVIVNSSATVDHDSVLEEGCHIAPGAKLGGDVVVGRRSLVAMGAVVTPGVRIGADVVVGAGSVVLEDVPDGARVWGVPARLQEERA